VAPAPVVLFLPARNEAPRVGAVLERVPDAVGGHPVVTIVVDDGSTDGQSGYRALSGEAAAAAEVIHDYNYAQVLTLDLVRKGFRYHEVPITYAFRSSGRSFVRLPTYLRNVVPAVARELRS